VLLEREVELGEFLGALEGARAGGGAILGVLAHFGGGRTALLDEFERRCTGEGHLRVARATAVMFQQDQHGAVAEALFDELMLCRGGVQPPADALAVAGAVTSLVATVRALTEGEPRGIPDRTDPLVILIDDLQWADLISLQALAALADAAVERPLLMVLSMVDHDPAMVGDELRELWSRVPAPLTLHPLSLAAVTRLANDALPTWLNAEQRAEVVTSCYRHTRGIPLLVGASLSSAAAGARAGDDDFASTIAAPNEASRGWLIDRFWSPVQGLPPVVRDVLTGIVVLGGPGELAELVGLDQSECDVAVGALARLGLVVADSSAQANGPPRSSHPVIEDTIENVLGRQAWAQWRLRAAELLYQRGAPSRRVADQLLAAGDYCRPWAIDVFRQAAWEVLAERGPADAARYLRAALLRIEPLAEQRAAVLLDLVEVEREFDPSAAVLHVMQAASLADGTVENARIFSRLAPAALVTCPTPLALTLGTIANELDRRIAAEGHAEGIGPVAELTARIRAREWYAVLQQPRRLRAISDRLVAGTDDLLEFAAGREQLAVMLQAAVVGMRTESSEVARQARQVLEREPATAAHVHTALPLLVATLVAADQLDGLRDWLEAAVEDVRRREHPVASCVMACEEALLELAAGDYPSARHHVNAFLESFQPSWRDNVPVVDVTILPVVAFLGDDLLMDSVLARLRRRGSTPYLTAGVAFASGTASARLGDHRSAADDFRTAGTLIEQCGWINPAILPWRIALATALTALDERDAALELLAEEHALADEWGAPATLGRVLRLRGALLGGNAGRSMLSDAVDVLTRSSDRREVGRAAIALGMHLRRDDDAAAFVHLEGGLAAARACGDEAAASKAASALTGGASVVRQSAADAVAQLTPTERRVVDKVMAGLSNPEIAREFGVSVRAVEKHLTRCYRKTGSSGRTELIRAVSWVNSAD
jgi:DNA-binding CsgD family transcriptional regulator